MDSDFIFGPKFSGQPFWLPLLTGSGRAHPATSGMTKSVAIIGAGVSGLTCGVFFAEHGFSVEIFAELVGSQATSGAAGALWFPYDAQPVDKVIPWALATYKALFDLAKDPVAGVSVLELRQYCRVGKIEIPSWTSSPMFAGAVERSLDISGSHFSSGFSLRVPLMDTTIYLDYLADRFQKSGGEIKSGVRFDRIEAVDRKFDFVINCAGIGARELAGDADLEPHRGQVAIVPKPDNLSCAVVCDDAPLMYAIPRTNDCVLGGTNDVSDNLSPDPETTKTIVVECSRVLNIDNSRVLRERVGLRPFRRSGVRLETERLPDGRTVLHNYGHGGSGFTVSWGCAQAVFELAKTAV